MTTINKQVIEGLGAMSRNAREEGRKICSNASIGAIVSNQAKHFLLVKRANPPYGFACVAGHALDEVDSWTGSMTAEIWQEVGIRTEERNLIPIDELQGAYSNICGKPGGSFHAWKVYSLEVEGTPGYPTGDPGIKAVTWVSPRRLQKLAEKTLNWYRRGKPEGEEEHLEPIWVIHLAKVGIVDVDYSLIDDIEQLEVDGNY